MTRPTTEAPTRPVMHPRDVARLWLKDYMRQHPEGVWANDAHAAARAAGHARRNIQLARPALGITALVMGRAGTIWKLPQEES